MSESLRDVRLFVAVYEERSFTAAALREHATQSGVSHHIRKMEERRGVSLFVRGSGLVVEPTPAGDAYYRGCLATLRAFHEANESLTPFGLGEAGELVVGLVPTVSQPLLAPVLAAFIAAHPNVLVRTVEAPSARLISEVRAGHLDLAIGFAVSGEVGVSCTPFARTPCYLVSRLGGRKQAGGRGGLDLTDWYPLHLAAPPQPNAIRVTIESSLASHGILVDRWLEIDSMAATLDFVSQTEWASIVPGLVLVNELRSPRVSAVPLRNPLIPLELSLIRPLRRGLTAPCEVFLQMLRREMKRHGPRYVEALGRTRYESR